jgi:hypothetical protein
MICSNFSETIGFTCHPLNDDGSVAAISTPFRFSDGEPFPIYVERDGKRVRFFDDGGVLLHLRGRGVRLNDQRNLKPIRAITEPVGVALNMLGELEIWSSVAEAPNGFSRYLAALMAVTSWERGLEGTATDMSLLLDEVESCLRMWKPHATLLLGEEFTGISGAHYKLDFSLDGQGVVAISPHPNTVSSTAKKLLDIRASTSNQSLEILIVIDDRRTEELAKREGLILDSLGNVMMMSRLETNARMGLSH